MKVLLPIGILLSVLAALGGLYLLLCGAMMGLVGVWVDGPISSVWLRVWGVGLFFLGGVYLTPVLMFSRQSFIITYAAGAWLVTAAAVTAFAFNTGARYMSFWDPILMAILMLTCPSALSGIAFYRSKIRKTMVEPNPPPNCGPGTPVGNSGGVEGPASVT